MTGGGKLKEKELGNVQGGLRLWIPNSRKEREQVKMKKGGVYI